MVKKVLDDAPAQEAGAAEDRHLSDICHLTHDRSTGSPVCAAAQALFQDSFAVDQWRSGEKSLPLKLMRFRLCSNLMEIQLWLLDSAG